MLADLKLYDNIFYLVNNLLIRMFGKHDKRLKIHLQLTRIVGPKIGFCMKLAFLFTRFMKVLVPKEKFALIVNPLRGFDLRGVFSVLTNRVNR